MIKVIDKAIKMKGQNGGSHSVSARMPTST